MNEYASIELEKMASEIEKGNVVHRRCDVCGCELAMPNIGLYSRDVLNTVACTYCSNTMPHRVLLAYIEDLRKIHTKQEILKILDERMIETWGEETNVFTIDDWNEQMKPNCERTRN